MSSKLSLLDQIEPKFRLDVNGTFKCLSDIFFDQKMLIGLSKYNQDGWKLGNYNSLEVLNFLQILELQEYCSVV